jgi:hypothetical protein
VGQAAGLPHVVADTAIDHSPRESIMAELQITLTAEERQCLLDVLGQMLKTQRIEEHRTRTPLYRETVLREEALITNVLKKLGAPPG